MIKAEIGRTFKTNLYSFLEALNPKKAKIIDIGLKKVLFGVETRIHEDHGVSIDMKSLDKSMQDKIWDFAADFLDAAHVNAGGANG